ncbi:hypothetical protein WN51_03839 [Melipona quadrifasciata]|uniref:Uncharacterized protein n=1 Tax=Melipona quadrifasciata TaxID=166423 RepID=A0A0M9AAW4_9HYME|nr:hypothetical protein WN51_03839 [Melipona quadrifasciata]
MIEQALLQRRRFDIFRVRRKIPSYLFERYGTTKLVILKIVSEYLCLIKYFWPDIWKIRELLHIGLRVSGSAAALLAIELGTTSIQIPPILMTDSGCLIEAHDTLPAFKLSDRVDKDLSIKQNRGEAKGTGGKRRRENTRILKGDLYKRVDSIEEERKNTRRVNREKSREIRRIEEEKSIRVKLVQLGSSWFSAR